MSETRAAKSFVFCFSISRRKSKVVILDYPQMPSSSQKRKEARDQTWEGFEANIGRPLPLGSFI